jgi:hypothetical protein
MGWRKEEDFQLNKFPSAFLALMAVTQGLPLGFGVK